MDTKRSEKFKREKRVVGVAEFHDFIQNELHFGLELESKAQGGQGIHWNCSIRWIKKEPNRGRSTQPRGLESCKAGRCR